MQHKEKSNEELSEEIADSLLDMNEFLKEWKMTNQIDMETLEFIAYAENDILQDVAWTKNKPKTNKRVSLPAVSWKKMEKQLKFWE